MVSNLGCPCGYNKWEIWQQTIVRQPASSLRLTCCSQHLGEVNHLVGCHQSTTHTHPCTHARTHPPTHPHTRTHARTHACTHTPTHTHMLHASGRTRPQPEPTSSRPGRSLFPRGRPLSDIPPVAPPPAPGTPPSQDPCAGLHHGLQQGPACGPPFTGVETNGENKIGQLTSIAPEG